MLLDLVVGIEVLQRRDLRLDFFHLRHRAVRAVGEREERELDEHRDNQNGDAEIADEFVDRIDQPVHRLGNEVEPAPVDHQVEFLDAELGGVIVDRRDFLGAGEDPGRGLDRGAWRDGLLLAEEIGLVVDRFHGPAGQVAGLDLGGLLGDDRRAPIFVGEPEPAANALVRLEFTGGLVDGGVGRRMLLVADHALKSFVQHRIAGDIRPAVTQDEFVGLHRRRRLAPIHDRSVIVNMYLSSTATTRLKMRPAPLSQVSVTGCVGVSVEARDEAF